MAQDHRIEPLAREVFCTHYPGAMFGWNEYSEPMKDDFRRIAAFILSREAARVGPLEEALERLLSAIEESDPSTISLLSREEWCAMARAALATYRALDAPPAPEPSLDEHIRAWRTDVVREFCERVDRDLCALSAPEPSLADVAAALVQSTHGAPDGYMWTRAEHVDALKSALAREREKAQP